MIVASGEKRNAFLLPQGGLRTFGHHRAGTVLGGTVTFLFDEATTGLGEKKPKVRGGIRHYKNKNVIFALTGAGLRPLFNFTNGFKKLQNNRQQACKNLESVALSRQIRDPKLIMMS